MPARQVFRDLIDVPTDVTITEHDIQVRFHHRAHLPIIAASGVLGRAVDGALVESDVPSDGDLTSHQGRGNVKQILLCGNSG